MRLIDADALRKRFDDEVPIRPILLTYNKEDVIRAVLDAPTIGGWISVKDRLPENDEEVVIGIASGSSSERMYFWKDAPMIVRRNHEMWKACDDATADIEVTHWMPLPEYPKEVTGDAI